MLAAAIPGSSFTDPLGGTESASAAAEASAAAADGDPPSANGTETAG